MLKRLLFLVCLVSPVLAVAEEETGERWFDIEVLVFKRAQIDSQNREQWPQDPGQPATDNAASLLPVEGMEQTPPHQPVPFQLLPSSSNQLNDALKKIQTSDSYKPLLHLAWRQPTYDTDKALPVLIKGGELLTQPFANSPGTGYIPVEVNEIEGTITVSVKRYLHMAVDLLLHVPAAVVDTSVLPLADDTQPVNPSSVTGMQSYRLTETRRMRSTEVHYLDHPAFGVLAVITPYEVPSPPEPVVETPVTVSPVPAVKP